MASKWEIEKENLEDLIVNQQLSYEEIGKRYGCTGSNIKKVAKRLEIDLPIRRNINPNETFNKKEKEVTFCLYCGKELTWTSKKYCNINCQGVHKSELTYNYFLTSPEEFQRANYSPKSFKKFILKEQNNKCSMCNCETIHNNKELVFILDHIDGNAANNTRENLRLVCPNCDSQLDTYKSKNKNGARSYYRYNKENSGIIGSNAQE